MNPSDRNPAETPWTVRLADLLRKAGAPVSTITAADGELSVVLDDGDNTAVA